MRKKPKGLSMTILEVKISIYKVPLFELSDNHCANGGFLIFQLSVIKNTKHGGGSYL
jgi:hypothetical protein